METVRDVCRSETAEATIDSFIAKRDRQGRQDDLRIIRSYHAAHGIPPHGAVRRLWWWLTRGEG